MRRLHLALLGVIAGCGDNRVAGQVAGPPDATLADASPPPIAKICPPGDPLSVLVVTRQTYWVHASNPVAAEAIRAIGAARGWRVELAGDPNIPDDPAVVTEDQLTRTDVIVFSVTSGIIFDDVQRALLERFFRSGGGYAATHSASMTEWDWPFYARMMPVLFKTHPVPFQGRMTIEAPGEPLLDDVPSPWIHFDEYYTFDRRPEDMGVRVLLALDETSEPDTAPADALIGYHPIAWTYDRGGVRSFYTALGHTVESYSEPVFLQALAHGIFWAGTEHYAARCHETAP